jgi:hypothetical protein
VQETLIAKDDEQRAAKKGHLTNSMREVEEKRLEALRKSLNEERQIQE